MKPSSLLIRLLAILMLLLTLLSCRHDDVVFPPENVETDAEPEFTEISGFYLLNEGNMGSNKATLDRYDYTTAVYTRNIYAEANPNVPKEMGDVGNDLKLYRDRLYAVINCSNKVEVMDAYTTKRIGQVDIPNCRYIAFDGDYAYVTSYAGPVEITEDYKQRGYVAKIDIATLEVIDRCIVGYQPDELTIYKGKIYVANSGGYMTPNYENTVSIIDLASFAVEGEMEVAINLQRVRADNYGHLWVTSRGDYYTEESALYVCDPVTRSVIRKYDIPVSDMDIVGDRLYVISTSWSYIDMADVISSAIIDTKTLNVTNEPLIADGSEKEMQKPYSVKVNPLTGERLVTDARSYINPGYLYSFDSAGCLQWKVRTGDIPAHIAFIPR